MATVEELETRLSAVEQSVASLIAASMAGRAVASGDGALWSLDALLQHPPESGVVLYAGAVDLPTGGVSQWQYALPAAALFEQDWSEQAAVLIALGHPVRLQILHEVLRGTNTVAALVEALGTGTSGQMYHHVKELTATGWLGSGRRAEYEVPPARIVPLLAILVAASTP